MKISSLAEVYRQSIREGHTFDATQYDTVERLECLGRELVSRSASKNWLKKILQLIGRELEPVKGLYVWGGVGRGKTYLMDLFFAWLPIPAKRRVHFHRFMSSVHAQLHDLKGTVNPLQVVTDRIASNAQVLCFDEFFVSDIGDAMILAEILRGLFERNVVLVATSNIEPKNLYENGLQRSRFLPAIELLENHTEIYELKGGTDYRLEVLRRRSLYRITDKTSLEDVRSDIAKLVEGGVELDTSIEVLGRQINCVFLADGVAGFTFADLCATPRSAEDYIELSRLLHTIVLYDLPILSSSDDSATRRFINLIDEFYDRNVNMLFNASQSITETYLGTQLKNEFERTQSRILEMQSDEYLSRAHKN